MHKWGSYFGLVPKVSAKKRQVMYFRVKHFDKYVGAFVLFAIVVLVVALVLVGRGQRWFEKRYTFTTIFNSAHGIEPGANVILSGIEIGAVKDISLNKNNTVKITLGVLDTYRDRIRVDSVAKISGPIIGSKAIEISVFSMAQPPLYEGGVIKSEETKEIPEMIAEIDFKSPMEKLTKTLDNIKSITENFNRESGAIATSLRSTTEQMDNSMGKITGGIEKITFNLVATTSEITMATKSLARALGNVETITGEIEAGKGNLGGAIKGRELYDNLLETTALTNKTLANLERASSDMPQLINGASGAIDDIKRAALNMVQIVNTGQENMEEARRILEALKKTWPISRKIKAPEPIGNISVDGREKLDK